MRTMRIAIPIILIATALPALADDPPETVTLRGEIVQVRQRTEAAGEPMTEIRVRTRERTETWVGLGPAADVGERFRVGDQVRVRGERIGPEGAVTASRVRNQRTGDRLRLRDGSGTLSRQRQRDRIHQPGSGTSSRAGTGGGCGRRGR